MGGRGPSPKPEWVKVLEGNPGKRPLKKTASKVKRQERDFASSQWLDQGAKAHWNSVAPALREAGLLTNLDLGLFAVYCQTYSDWIRVEKLLKDTGPVYITPSGQARPRPEVAVAQQYLASILEFSKEFGMTPASRARLSLPRSPEDKSDFDRWLDGS